jgi:signal transduction histidine kinase/DNA-binding response OmpR family regulator
LKIFFILTKIKPMSAYVFYGSKRIVFWVNGVLVLFLLFFTASADLSGQRGSIKFIKNYTPDRYRSHSINWAVTQDRRGFILAANHAGLIQYDGVSWRVFKIKNQTVRSFARGPNDALYIGGRDELGVLEPDENGTLRYKSLLDYLSGDNKNFGLVFNTLRTEQGIYSRTVKYLFRWDLKGEKMKVWQADGGFGRIFACQGRVLVQQPKIGLTIMDGDRLEALPGCGVFKGKKLSMVIPYGQDSQKLLIGTRGSGLYVYDGQTAERFPTEVDDWLAEKELYHGIRLSGPSGDIALATRWGGLLILDSRGNLKDIYDKSRGLLADNVKYVYEDFQGNLWLGLERGISKIEYKSLFNIYDDRLGLHGLILSAAKHKTNPRDILYVGTTWGLYYLDLAAPAGKFRQVQTISGMCHALLGAHDSLLAACDRGLFRVQDGEATGTLDKKRCYALLRSSLEPRRVWVGKAGGLAAFFFESDGKKWLEENTFPGIAANVKTIVEDPGGNLWLGTDTEGAVKVDFFVPGGIDRYKTTRFHIAHGLPAGRVSVFLAAGRVMFATEKGLFRFDEKNKRFVPDFILGKEYADGSRDVFLVAEDKNKNIYFHSQRSSVQAIPGPDGVYEINRAPFLRIPPTQVNDIFPENDNDCIWLAAVDALYRYDTIPPRDYRQLFPIFIRSVQVNGKTVFETHHGAPGSSALPAFAYRDRKIRFQFAAPFFEDESATRYCYLLEGYDRDWSTWGAAAHVDYTNLDPRKYRFRVKARNVYGTESIEAAFPFEILPPLYRTWWAYSFYVLVAGLLFYGAVRWRLSRLEKDKQRLRRHIKEATREIESKNSQLETQARELKEMAAVRTRFFANISHEFRTPLTLIMGPLEQMLCRCDDDRRRKKLEMMRRNSWRLLTLINQLLALSKIDKGKMKLNACAQNILPFLKGILASFQLAAAQNGIDIDFHSSAESITVYYDPEKMEDVFCNLFLNILNLTPPGEKLIVGARTIEADKAVFLEASVRISGLEMPDEQLTRIFDRLYLSDESYEHQARRSGIGLTLAKELVSLHHGDIQARRCEQDGGGTIFSLRLPLGSGHLEPGEIVDASLFPTGIKSSREIPILPAVETNDGEAAGEKIARRSPEKEEKLIILLVEDSVDTREFVSECLGDLYRVEEAGNGREGINKARELIPDLIISDIVMPVADGYELCRELKKDIRTSHVPIILLTAKEGEENILKGFETGADDYITKPFNTRLLHARIKNLIELRQQWQQKIGRQMGLQPAEISVSSIDEVFIKELQEIIEKNLSDPEFKVEQLAKKLYLSRATLYRKIHALTGEPPHRFIRSYRLKRAAQLLKARFGNVGEVALEVGFTNISYFSQCFKEKFHQLPSEYLDTVSMSRTAFVRPGG